MKAKISTVFLSFLAIWLGSGVLCAQCASDSVECIHLALVPEATAYKLGKPIIVNMVFTNLSEHDIPLALIHAVDQGYSYHFEVTQTVTGKHLDRTEEGKQLAYENLHGTNPHPNEVKPRIIMGGGQIPLTPHESRTYPTILSRIFEFKEPGTYRVEVLRDESKFQVAPITIVVEP